jgi:hypothetical protein
MRPRLGPQSTCRFQAINPRHLYVENNQMGQELWCCNQGFFSTVHGANLAPKQLEKLTERLRAVVTIINNEDTIRRAAR